MVLTQAEAHRIHILERMLTQFRKELDEMVIDEWVNLDIQCIAFGPPKDDALRKLLVVLHDKGLHNVAAPFEARAEDIAKFERELDALKAKQDESIVRGMVLHPGMFTL